MEDESVDLVSEFRAWKEQSSKDHEALKDSVDKLSHAIMGNGNPGLKSQMLVQDQRISQLEKAVDEAKDSSNQKWSGALSIVAVVITLVIGIISIFK